MWLHPGLPSQMRTPKLLLREGTLTPRESASDLDTPTNALKSAASSASTHSNSRFKMGESSIRMVSRTAMWSGSPVAQTLTGTSLSHFSTVGVVPPAAASEDFPVDVDASGRPVAVAIP